jgi:hypothetical protein
MKKILSIWIILILSITLIPIPSFTNADSSEMDVEWFEIMPKLEPEEITEVNEAIEAVWSKGWEVRKTYNDRANELKTPSKQLASWIMNRDTILNYLVFVVKFLGQLWLLVWACFIMYAWYKYMVSVFTWGKSPNSTLKNAIIWVIIVVFSYAIMKIFTSIIWLT